MIRTRAERTGYRETSLHADVMAFVEALVALGDRRLHVSTFGTSPQGRDLPLLVLSTQGVRTPEDARAAGLPVVLMVDGIHPGEVEGKEATLAMVRDVLTGRGGEGRGGEGRGGEGRGGEWLEHLTLVVVPLFNPDGNDALDPANRRLDLDRLRGQPDPVVGTRTQSEGINLNRDYMRHQTSEMRDLQQRVCHRWQPDLTIDNHATNGSVHRMAMTVDVPHTIASGRSEPIAFMRDRLVPAVMAQVAARGIRSGWYGNFVEDERALAAAGRADPGGAVGEGWTTYPHHPRFGSNYRGLTNRLDLLLECYSYLPFEERVATASAWQIETLTWVAAHADAVRQVVADSQTPPPEVAVRYRLEASDAPVTIPTFAPRRPGEAPVDVTLPHLSRFVGTAVVERPRAYAVPPEVAAHLLSHGLTVDPAEGDVDASVATVASIGTEAGRAILEAGQTGDVAVSWQRGGRRLPPGYALVSTEQPLGAVAVYLCEPESDDGIVENGIVPAVGVGGVHPVWRVHDR